jgi:hypothetical protein
MVKSGEVYVSDSEFNVRSGYLMDQESRPRAVMNPSKHRVGIMAAI